VLSDHYVVNALGLGSQLQYGYDSLLRRTNLDNVSLGGNVTYGYDAASRLASVSDGTNSAAYGYIDNSPLVGQITLSQNGVTRMTTTKGYDNLNRLTNVMNAASVNMSSAYQYNMANQRTNQLREDGTYWVYQYDALGQVTSGKKYWSDGTPVAGQQFTYNFDTIGNRKSAASGGDALGANLRSASYTNNLLNQITSRDVPGYVEDQGSASSNATVTVNGASAYRKGNYYRGELTVGNSSAPVYLAITNQGALDTNNVFINGHVLVAQTPETNSYDADGNLTQDGKWSYTWDAENRLIGMQSLSTIPDSAKRQMTYAYDDQGRRIYAKIMEWNTNSSSYTLVTEERYWYDGWNIIGRADLATTLVQNFVWGLDLSGTMQGAGGIGGLLILDDSQNNSYFYDYDGNGNVLGLVNANDGTTAAQYDYDPFLGVIRANGLMAKVNPFLGSTKFYDWQTEIYNFGYRPYKPIGTWLSKDPIKELGGLNLNAFVENDAINHGDYLGLLDIVASGVSPFPQWNQTTYLGDNVGRLYFPNGFQSYGSRNSIESTILTLGAKSIYDYDMTGKQIADAWAASTDTSDRIIAHSQGVANALKGIEDLTKKTCCVKTIHAVFAAPKVSPAWVNRRLKKIEHNCPNLKLDILIIYSPKDRVIPRLGWPPLPGQWQTNQLHNDGQINVTEIQASTTMLGHGSDALLGVGSLGQFEEQNQAIQNRINSFIQDWQNGNNDDYLAN